MGRQKNDQLEWFTSDRVNSLSCSLQPLQPCIPTMQRGLLPAPFSEAPPPSRLTSPLSGAPISVALLTSFYPKGLQLLLPHYGQLVLFNNLWWREAPWDLVKAKKMPVTVSMNACLLEKFLLLLQKKKKGVKSCWSMQRHYPHFSPLGKYLLRCCSLNFATFIIWGLLGILGHFVCRASVSKFCSVTTDFPTLGLSRVSWCWFALCWKFGLSRVLDSSNSRELESSAALHSFVMRHIFRMLWKLLVVLLCMAILKTNIY